MSERGRLLGIEGLDLEFRSGAARAHALRGVYLEVRREEIHALVGESGSGKTATVLAALGLIPSPPAVVSAGRIVFEGTDLLQLDARALREVRGGRIGMVFQEPSRYLNPSLTAGEQIAEMVRVHRRLDRFRALDRARELLELVGLTGGDRVLRSYPHELSGGMRQRVMIAMAISCEPALLIADEPTTALDVTIQRQILDLLLALRDRLQMAVLVITHDLAVVDSIADTVSVIYAGRVVESGPRADVLGDPQHPYTRLLLGSIPDARHRGRPLVAIRGRVPDAEAIPDGCPFHPRCPLADQRCRVDDPPIQHRSNRSVACYHAGEPL